MDDDLRQRLDKISTELHMRALELSHPGQSHDMATLMSALAVALEAIRVIGDSVNALNDRAGRR